MRPALLLLEALCEADPAAKCARVAALPASSGIDDECGARLAQDPRIPGRPARPALVSPRDVPYRGLGSAEGRAALVHAVAHIEFNAVNLALDAALRFDGMPADYYADWIGVARDEARHFGLLIARLAELGHAYGDFPAHNGLWEAAEKTAHDPLLRMALVPRVLEARGLDVTPGMIHRLREVGDARTAEMLGVILDEEVAHVAIGTRWFRYLCARRGLDPVQTFRTLLSEHRVRLQRPLNEAARVRAGFEALELEPTGEVGSHPR
jgi:uncharacterized ferritin-like protein (DUF455 family)